MTNPHCRIGTIRHKFAPHLAELRPEPRGRGFEAEMKRNFDTMCGFFRDEGIAGIAMVAWGFDGRFSRSTRVHPDSPIGQTLLPSFVAEVLRRDISASVTMDVLDGDV